MNTYPCEGGCGRTLRTRTTKPEDAPGTIRECSNRMCQKCHAKQAGLSTGGRPKREPTYPCPGGCGKTIRRRSTTRPSQHDYPGTVIAQGDGMCGPCYNKQPDKDVRPVNQVREDLDAFLRTIKRAGASKSPLIKHPQVTA